MLALPEDVLRQYLIDIGAAVHPPPVSSGASTWPIVTGAMPAISDRDNFLSVLGTGDFIETGRLRATGAYLARHPTVQIYIRSADYKTGAQKGRAIEAALLRIGAIPPEGLAPPLVIVGNERCVILAIMVMTATMWIGRDEQNRRQDFTLNVRMSLADG